MVKCPECRSEGEATDIKGIFICVNYACSVLTFREDKVNGDKLIMRANGSRL